MANNNQPGNISNEQLSQMLNMASSKLGMSPGQLKSILSDKKATDDLLTRIGGQNKLNTALSNPESIQKMINDNPKAKKMLGDLLGEKHNG